MPPAPPPSSSDEALTPEERADLVVTRLERYIREHRTLTGGVSFRRWQDLARAEIASALRQSEVEAEHERHVVQRTLIVLGAGLATVGVWGVALALLTASGPAVVSRGLAGVLVAGGGLAVLWVAGALGLRAPLRRFQVGTARRRLVRVRSLARQVGDLEQHLKARRKALEKERDALPED